MERQIMTVSQIETEILRRAKVAALERRERFPVAIPLPRITRYPEPNSEGVHWKLNHATEPGSNYAFAAALEIGKIWDISPPQ